MNRSSRRCSADGAFRICECIQILLSVLIILSNSFPATADSGVPLILIENAGQFGDGARYQVAGRGMTLWIADDALWITAMEKEKTDEKKSGALSGETSKSGLRDRRAGRGETDAPKKGVALKLTFPGGNDHPKIEPFGRLETRISYFRGNDPEKWNPDVPVWSGVRYIDIYPGVDLEIAGENGVLAPRFVVRDSGRARAAKFFEKAALRIEGVDGLDCDSEAIRCATGIGDVIIPLFGLEYRSGHKAAGSSSESTTTISEPSIAGENVLRPFAARSPDDRTTGRGAGAEDMTYGTFLGGSDWDFGYGIAADASGNVHVTGKTESLYFPVTVGSFETTTGGGRDVFVVKLNATGTALVYGTFLGGNDVDSGNGIVIDASGNAYITGETGSANFPVTPGAFQITFGGYTDAFVAQLNEAGTALVYSTYLGGSSNEEGAGIAADSSGNAYVTGWTLSSPFPVKWGAFQIKRGGGFDAFIVKLNADGSALLYGTYLGGNSNDEGNGIAIDASGDVCVTGYTSSSNFPVTSGSVQGTYGGGSDAFVSKLNATGSALVYGTYLGGNGDDEGNGIAVDASGDVCVTGDTSSSNFPVTSGSVQTTYGGGSDAFVSKLNATGSALVYGTYLGGSEDDYGNGIAKDASGNAYVTGYTESVNFPFTAGSFQTTYGGGNCDAFVVRLNPTGAAIVYATYLGGRGYDWGTGIVADAYGNAYVTGYTSSSNFPVTSGAFQTTYHGSYDAFATKLRTGAAAPTPTPTPAPVPSDFNADGKPDLVWQEMSTKQLCVWLMNGTKRTSGIYLTPSTATGNWKAVGTGDFNADGKPDILWQELSTKQLCVWLMNGMKRTSGIYLTPSSVTGAWRVVAVADFNADGKPDILWQETSTKQLCVWLMNGTKRTSGIYLTPSSVTGNWKAVGTGDFNADGKPDILWQEASTKQLCVWLMNGTKRTSGVYVTPSSVTGNWKAVAIADYNADGKPDILFQEMSTKQLCVWTMNGTKRTSGIYLTPSSATGAWRISGGTGAWADLAVSGSSAATDAPGATGGEGMVDGERTAESPASGSKHGGCDAGAGLIAALLLLPVLLTKSGRKPK